MKMSIGISKIWDNIINLSFNFIFNQILKKSLTWFKIKCLLLKKYILGNTEEYTNTLTPIENVYVFVCMYE